MSLHAILPADNKNRVVQNAQRPFHFRREIHMSRRVQEHDFRIFKFQLRLLGKNRNSAGPLLGVRIKKSVLMIHSSQLSDRARRVEQRFR